MTGIPVAGGELVDIGYLNEVARAHYRKTTSKQVLNTVVETDLLNGEVTIGAGAMGTTRAIRLTAIGDWITFSGAATDVPRLKLKLGGTTLIDTNVTGAAVASSTNQRNPWRVDVLIQNLGATNAQWVSWNSRMVIPLGAAVGANNVTTGEGPIATILGTVTTGARLVDANAANTTAVDTTVANLLALTTTNPTATATCDVTLKFALVELV